MTNFLEQLRKERGWSMATLGERCTPPATAPEINKLEKGITQLTPRWLHRLADALECYYLDILDGGGERIVDPDEREVIQNYRSLSENAKPTARTVLKALRQNPAPDAAADIAESKTGNKPTNSSKKSAKG